MAVANNCLDFRNDTVDAAGNGAGTQRHRPVRRDLPPECRRPHRHCPTALGRSRYASGDRDRAKAHRSGFGVRNFNTWDLAQRFESADARYQLAVMVAASKTALAELLRRLRRRHSPLRLYSGQAWAAGTSASQLVEYAWQSALIACRQSCGMTRKWSSSRTRRSRGLVSWASQIRALGQ